MHSNSDLDDQPSLDLPLTFGLLFLGMGISWMSVHFGRIQLFVTQAMLRLYGVTCAQSSFYFRTYAKEDPRWIRILVNLQVIRDLSYWTNIRVIDLVTSVS
jgi:hypothetical protein